MIVIIADDLSGAAELANAAVVAGFSAEVQMCASLSPVFPSGSSSEIICLDTDSRSLPREKAGEKAGQIALRVAAVRPALVYKKCDSVLRGPIAAESLAIARALGRTRVLLVPANPSRRRVIRGGEYFVDGVPLAQTAFARDPEHPRLSSSVVELIGHAVGIETPDAVSTADLDRHAASVDAATLPVGGVDFFNAVLKAKFPVSQKNPAVPSPAVPATGPSLFVCGSHAAWLGGRNSHCEAHGIPSFSMPPDLFKPEYSGESLARWASAAADALREQGAALLAIGGEQLRANLVSDFLAARLAAAVQLILASCPTARVYLEGGATASAVVRQLGLHRFITQLSPGPGVGALLPLDQPGPVFLIKPGSYPWPDSVWPPATAP